MALFIPALFAGAAPAIASFLSFDGASTFVEWSTGPSTVTDGRRGTFVVPFNRKGGSGAECILYVGTTTGESVFIGFDATDNLVCRISDGAASPTAILTLTSTTTYSDSTNRVAIFSYDLDTIGAGALYWLYVNDTDETGTPTTGTAEDIDLTDTWRIGSTDDATSAATRQWYSGATGHILFADDVYDISDGTIRDAFYDAAIDGPVDQGADGSTTLGFSPPLYWATTAAAATANKGDGGNASSASSFSDAASPPNLGTYAGSVITDAHANQRVTAITIDAAQVSDADTADLTDFPVLITHAMLITNASAALDADGSNPMQTDGGDLKFYSDAARTTRLACDVVNVSLNNDPALSLLEVWVKVPTVDYNDNTTIYMTYDSASGVAQQPAVGDTYGRNAVWSDYVAVLHLNTSSWVDSTGNGHTGSATGTPTTSTANHPWGGTWMDVDGATSADYLTLASSANMLDGAAVTVQAWHRANSTTAATRGITSNDDGTAGDWFRLTSHSGATGRLNCAFEEDASEFIAQPLVTPQNVPRLGAVILSSSTAIGQINTSRVTGTSASGDGSLVMADSTFIGSYNARSASLSWDGEIGEVRFRKSALTEGWLSTEYNMGNAPGSFATAATPTAI